MGPSSKDVSIMLEKIGVSSVEQLISETIPKNIRLTKTLDLDTPLSEHEYLKHIQELSEHNQVCKTYIGLGYHETVTPPVIQRNIFEIQDGTPHTHPIRQKLLRVVWRHC